MCLCYVINWEISYYTCVILICNICDIWWFLQLFAPFTLHHDLLSTWSALIYVMILPSELFVGTSGASNQTK